MPQIRLNMRRVLEKFVETFDYLYGDENERFVEEVEYLDYYNFKTGYMMIFNFNKKKEIGVKEVRYGDRVIVEATV